VHSDVHAPKMISNACCYSHAVMEERINIRASKMILFIKYIEISTMTISAVTKSRRVEQRVFNIISRFPHASADFIARMFNVPCTGANHKPLTNEYINSFEMYNVDEVEDALKRLLAKQKIVQGCAGVPKRYVEKFGSMFHDDVEFDEYM
jgi:hypothetical protein